MGCALESYVIDNDRLEVVMKSLSGIEVNDETLALQAIDEAAHGEGPFLGRTETLEHMQSDFVYLEIGDRRTIDAWAVDGSQDIRSVAIDRMRQILQTHYPDHLTEELDRRLHEKFDIRLPQSDMQMNQAINTLSIRPFHCFRSSGNDVNYSNTTTGENNRGKNL